MTTQEDRHSREYNKSFSHSGEYDRAPLKEGNMSFDVKLKNEISKCMKGFRATNVITYKRFRDKSTWHRPSEVISLFADKDDEDEFTPDPKETWPIMQNMNIDLPIKEITKRHRVLDRDWTVPPSTKKFKQPEPVYPQSTGVKLRPVEDIMNEYSKASQYKAPVSASTKPPLALGKNTPRVQDKTNCLLEPIPDKIKGVLQNITETTRRKPAVAAAPKIYASKPQSNDKIHKSNVPRRPSLLKSAISPEKLDSKKPPAPVNVAQSTNASSARPRVSSKSMPIATTTVTEKPKYTENIPDLIEARKYLLGDVDEVEFRNLKNLAQAPRVTDSMQRPVLCFHFPNVVDEMNKIGKALDLKKTKARAGKTIKSTKPSVNNNKKLLNNVQQEKPALQPTNTSKKTISSKPMTKSATINKSIKTDSSVQPTKKIPTKVEANTTSKNITTNTNTPAVTKKSLSDQNNHSQPKDEEKPAVVPEGDKQVYPSSVSAAFLKSIKIPKRVNKVTDMELEEGETISPSPSPIRTQNDSTRKPSHSSMSTSSSNISAKEVVVDDNESSRKRSSRRRDEERSTKRDDERSCSSRRDSRSESRRDRCHRPSYHRSRSRTRSRSPTRDSHRSSSRTHHRSDRSERKASPEPSRERRRSPTRTERDSHKRKSSSSDNDTNSTTSSQALTSKKHGDSEPPIKRQATEKKILPSDEEKDKKYTTSNNNNVSSSSSKSVNSSNKKTLPSTSNNSTPKSTSMPTNAATATTTKAAVAPTIAKTTATKATHPPTTTQTTAAANTSASLPAASLPTENTISATASNAETPEQYKLFTIMFNKSAHASKRRGDTETDPVFSILDHFHALCDYILNFYYVDKANPQVPFKQASIAWKSLFPFSDSLIKRLESHRLNDLYGLCVRLISLIRYYIYSRMESSTRPLLTKQLVNGNDESYTDRSCIEMTEGLLREHEKAERCYVDSERFLTYGTIATQFPETFKNVCIHGNVLAGIMLGGEAGVSVGPMFPFTPYSPLHHAAIASKCLLSEYVTKNNLRYTPISNPEEFM